MEKAQLFFENHSGEKVLDFFQIPQSGSSRKNFVAVTSEQKYIITENDYVRENESFLYFSKIFEGLNLNTPNIYHVSGDKKIYIQTYLGDETLSQVIENEGTSPRVEDLVRKSLTALYQLQEKSAGKIDFEKAYDYETYDDLPITHDLYYFKNFLVDVLDIPYHKSTLLKEFKKIVNKIETLSPKGLMIRDFQSRNIIVDQQDKVYFIDYQSAMYGPLMYDVVSFLFQAKANFPQEFRQEMIKYYLDHHTDEKTRNDLEQSIPYMMLMRFVQVLGAYGLRGLIQGKDHFLNSIELGIDNIVEFAKDWEEMSSYPELSKIFVQLQDETTKSKIKRIIAKHRK